MQDEKTGELIELSEKAIKSLSGKGNGVIRVGDVFKVRGCCFRIKTIETTGIEASGISRKEYHAARRNKVKSSRQSPA